MKYKKRTKALNWLVSLALILSLVPMFGTTAKADNGSAYNDYLVTTETNKDKSGDALTALQVTFNDMPWYIIADNSVSATSGTVTLLAADGSFGKSKFSDNNSADYNDSTIKAALDAMTTSGGSFANVADAIMTNNDAGGKLYLLSKSEVDALPINVKEISIDGSRAWWTRTTDEGSIVLCACRNGVERAVNSAPDISWGVRPALQLDLSAVTFLAETKTFTLNSIYTVEGDGSVTLNNMTREQLQKLYDESGKLTVDLSDVSGSNSLKIPSETVTNMKELDEIKETTLSVWMKEDTGSGSTIAEWYGLEIPSDLLDGETSLQVNKITDLNTSDFLNDAQKKSAVKFSLSGDVKCVALSLTGNSGAGSGINLNDFGDQSINFYISQPDGWSEDEWKNTTAYYLNDLGGFEPLSMKLGTKETASGNKNYGELKLLHCSIYMLVIKANQSAPAAPTMVDSTIGSVTLNAIENGEYKCGDGEWQESPVFTGLAMNTEYTFYQRLKGDVGHNASPSSEGANFSTADHVHSWSYSAGGETITATCTADGCTLDDGTEQHKHAVTLTIVKPTLTTYGQTGEGISASATLTGLTDFNTATGLNVQASSIIYWKAKIQDGVYKTDGDQPLTAAPTSAGNYLAKITVNNCIAAVGYTINKADPTAPTGLTATYGQTLADVTLPDGWTWKDRAQSVGDVVSPAATFKANFAENDNYNAASDVDVTVTVGKADPTAPTGLTATYGQTLADVTLPDGWTWKDSTQSVGNVVDPAATFKANFAENDNYNAAFDVDVTVTVGKADPTAPTGLTATYGQTLEDVTLPDGWTWKDSMQSVGNVVDPAATFKANFAGDDNHNAASNVDVTVTVGKADPTAPTGLTATYGQTLADVTLPDGWTWKDSTQSVGNVVDPAATFKANFTGNDNYNVASNVDVTVTVGKANAVAATVTANSRTYDGTEKPLVTVAGETIGGTLKIAVTTVDQEPDDGAYTFDTTSIPAKTDAGTYYVWYKVVGDANHNSTEPNSVEAKINPVDKTDLNTAIEEAEAYYESIKEDDVYAQVAEALKKAIDEAKKYTNDNVAEKEVKEAIDTIKAAKVAAEEGKKEADDTVVANEVADAINALPDGDEVEVTDKEKIEAARKAYDTLTDDQKEKVPADTLKKLEDAEKALEDAEQKEAEKEAADTEAAKKVTDAINALSTSDKIATTDKEAIEAARKAYDALTDDQKAKVSAETLKKLEDAEKALEDAEKNTSDDDKRDEDKPDYKNEWVDGQWYGADGNTEYKAKGSWKQNDKGWWYEDTDGWYPKSQWQKIDGKWYYFTADGYMDYSEYRDGYWLGSDGAWDEAYSGGHWMQDSTGWWYVDATGWYPVNQYLWVDGVQYWFNANGYWE